MSNDSHEPATTSRRSGRPRQLDATPIAQTDAEHAIHLMRANILHALPPGADHARVAVDLKALGEMHEIKAHHDQPFLSIQRLMERYGLARKTVERLPLPRHKIGNAVRYAAADVEAYEATRREEHARNAD
jgi:predicted DNA-binding transcriptional regulator AlpA